MYPDQPKLRDLQRMLSTTTTKAEQNLTAHEVISPEKSQRRKRKRSCGGETSYKRVETCASYDTASTAGADIVDGSTFDNQTSTDPVAHWASKHRWPRNFATMSQATSASSKKRPPSLSYTQSYRNGEVPRAHSRAYEALLAENGLFMDESKAKKLVNQESKLLCARLLRASYSEPEHTSYPLSKFTDVWQCVQSHNETRLFRDITPLLVPSPELLYVSGHQELEHIAETLSAEWTKVKTLCGPNPKPDQVIGLMQSAFSDEEVVKLKNYTSFQRSTLFGENVYFPFLLVEAKCGEDGINKADRQNMHSSSIALNAILELHLILDDGRNKAAALNGQILIFSISHDNERVKLFGHFAIVEHEKISFYRYYFEAFTLNLEERQGRKRTHDFVRAVYDIFYPAHLSRIRKALAEMRDPRSVSMTSNMSIDETDSQISAARASSSQKTEIDFLRKQLAEQKRQDREQLDLLKEQMTEQKRQDREQLDLLKEQLTEQQRQSREQLDLMKEQLTEQQRQSREQLDLLKELMTEQRR